LAASYWGAYASGRDLNGCHTLSRAMPEFGLRGFT
jgi:hypothetical protein